MSQASGGRFLLVLDEYPYLEEAYLGLASVQRSAWDYELRETRLKWTHAAAE